MQVFGRSGTELLAVFSDPTALEDAGKAAGGMADIFQRQAATFARITNDLEALGHKMRGFFAGVADQIAPVLLPLLDRLKTIDLTRVGEQVGGVVRTMAVAFSNSHFGELFSTSMEVGIAEAINYLADALPPIAASLDSLLGKDLDALSTGLGSMFEGLFDMITGGLMRAFEGPVRYLQAGIEHVMQMRQANQDAASGKRIDLEGYGLMGSAGVQRRVDQLITLLGKPGLTNDQVGYYSKQLERARAYQDDPNSFGQVVQSIDQIMKSHADEQVRFGSGAGKTADEWTREGRSAMNQVPAQMSAAISSIGDTIKTLFADMHRVNIVDDKAAKDRLANLLGQLKGLASATSNSLDSKGAAGTLSGMGATTKFDGDRLARIGGFVGGGGGPALDFNRRTASATEKTVQLLNGIKDKLQTGGGSLVPTWG